MKDLIIKIEKRVEELAQQSWEPQNSVSVPLILAEIAWLESLLPDLEKMLDKQA